MVKIWVMEIKSTHHQSLLLITTIWRQISTTKGIRFPSIRQSLACLSKTFRSYSPVFQKTPCNLQGSWIVWQQKRWIKWTPPTTSLCQPTIAMTRHCWKMMKMTWSSIFRTKENFQSLDPRYPLLNIARTRYRRQNIISSPSYRWICSFNFRRWLTYTFYSRLLSRQFLRSQWLVTSQLSSQDWFQLYSSPCLRICLRTWRDALKTTLRITRLFRESTRSLMDSKTNLGKTSRLDRS
jgi:hypothetical protein